jgi:hypothetical protein
MDKMPVVDGRYNWKGQSERLIYMGAKRYAGDNRPWHQFAKVDAPNVCWCEVLASDLVHFEETKEQP